ncbi:hypothetical protein LPTSP4_02020 [Leptospira ryugenii]|uniref:DUF3999 domain-containing protein n=1 Tax=Leptospira ryugenii TaxID=1917863 RepID=A0A2P2DVN2_9LEPT|nr:hypothetical protein [Leptospira ryugenii]GBF48702.1 hypothetical protein LPTSP4_02020 [Leptospira ryugenii]
MKHIILFLICNLSLLASPFQEKNFRYLKDIEPPKTQDTQGKVVSILLDDEIYLHSFYEDLRIVSGGQLIPYIRRELKQTKSTPEKIEPKLLFKKKDKTETIYVLELPKLPKDFVYTELELSSEEKYEAELTVSTGQNPNALTDSQTLNAYSYGEEAQNVFNIGPTKNRFVRVAVKGNEPIKFTSVSRERVGSNQVWSKEISEFNLTASSEKTTYTISNISKSPFNKIKLKFEEQKLNRYIEIEEFFNEKEWQLVFSGNIDYNQEENPDFEINFDRMVYSTYRIHIFTGDNPLVHLKSLTQTKAKEELLFFLPESSSPELKIYYGNRYSRFPEFDTYLLPEENSESMERLQISPQKENSEFGYSLIEPPISGYVASALFYIGLLALSFLSYRFYRKIETDEKELTNINDRKQTETST